MAARYFILILSAVPRRSGSMAAPSPPLKSHPKGKEAEPAPRKLQMKPIPEARGSLLRLLLHFVRRLARHRLLRFVLTVPIFLHRWGRSPIPTWILRKKSRTAGGLNLSFTSRSPTRYFCFPFFVASSPTSRPVDLSTCNSAWRGGLSSVEYHYCSPGRTTSSGRPVCYPCSSGTRP